MAFFGLDPTIYSKKDRAILNNDIAEKLKNIGYYVETNKQNHNWKKNIDETLMNIKLIFNKVSSSIEKLYSDTELINSIHSLSNNINASNYTEINNYIIDKVSKDYSVIGNKNEFIKVYTEVIVLLYKKNIQTFISSLFKEYKRYIQLFLDNSTFNMTKDEYEDYINRNSSQFKALSILICELHKKDIIQLNIIDCILKDLVLNFNNSQSKVLILQVFEIMSIIDINLLDLEYYKSNIQLKEKKGMIYFKYLDFIDSLKIQVKEDDGFTVIKKKNKKRVVIPNFPSNPNIPSTQKTIIPGFKVKSLKT